MARRDDREGLSSLNDLNDYEVADGEPDPRGWDVFASDGVKVGRIEDLLVDTGEMRVRAIECRVDEKGLNLPSGENSMYIPIRSVSLDESAQRAVVPNLRSDQVESFRGRPGFAEFETGTRGTGARTGAFGGVTTGRTARGITGRESGRGTTEREEVHIPRSEEQLDIGKRTVRAGEVDVHKRVETQHVSEPVRVRHEEVDIERHSVTGRRAGGAEIGEEDVRIPVSEEEIVVSKHPVVREEIVLRKRGIDETRRAEADLRKERVDIETKGDVHTRNESERGRRR